MATATKPLLKNERLRSFPSLGKNDASKTSCLMRRKSLLPSLQRVGVHSGAGLKNGLDGAAEHAFLRRRFDEHRVESGGILPARKIDPSRENDNRKLTVQIA